MLTRIDVIGRGRVGAAVAARLLERGLDLDSGNPELVILCVPDGAIVEVAAGIPVGPWVAHVSGATPLAALAPHELRLSVHPLQTFTRARGPEQLDGAWAAVTAESVELPPFPLRDPLNQISSPLGDHASPCSDFQPDESVVLLPSRSTTATDPAVSPSRSWSRNAIRSALGDTRGCVIHPLAR